MFYGKEVMSATTQTAPEPIPRPSGSPTNFTQAMELYRTNYIDYRATGKAEYKIAYENAEKWIQQYLNTMRTGIANDAAGIQKFVQDYQDANPELVELQRKFQVIRETGPKLQDQYSTVRRLNTERPEVDYTSYYIRGGLIVAVLGLVFVLSR